MIGTQWYSEDMEDATGVAPDGSGGSAGSEEVNVRRRGLVAALRSGRYEQTMRVLARIVNLGVDDRPRKVRYCCLGVACEVAIADGLELPRTDVEAFATVFYGQEGDMSNNVLPWQAQEWFWFDDSNPNLKIPYGIVGDISDRWHDARDRNVWVVAAELNDSGMDFGQIADCFEYTFLPDDWEVTLASR